MDGIRAAALAAGRPADAVKVLAGAMFLTGPTEDAARARYEEMLAYSTPEGAAAIFAGNTGVDLLALDPDQPIPPGTTTQQGLSNLQRYLGTPDAPGPLVREIIEDFRTTGINGTVFVGTGDAIVDQVAEFRATTGVDGFLIQPHLMPGTYDDLIAHVLPVLRSRGMARATAPTGTLRQQMFGAGDRLPQTHPGHRSR